MEDSVIEVVEPALTKLPWNIHASVTHGFDLYVIQENVELRKSKHLWLWSLNFEIFS